MFAKIAGLGQWFPTKIKYNSEWPKEFIEKREGDRALLENENNDPFLGSKERRVAESSFSSSEAEALAAQEALKDASISPSKIDAVLSWALVPDRIMPSNACKVCDILNLKNAWASSVDSACASPIPQLEIAASLIESGRARTVLLTQSHLSTRTFPVMHPSSPCMGDGASAIVVTDSLIPGILTTNIKTHGEFYNTVMWCRGRSLKEDDPWWISGDSFIMSSRDPENTKKLIKDVVLMGSKTIKELSEKANFNLSDIKILASVQPRKWIPGAIAKDLGLNENIAPETFEKYAHLGGVGAIVNLLYARNQGLLKKNDLVVLYAQGAGFTRAAIALNWR